MQLLKPQLHLKKNSEQILQVQRGNYVINTKGFLSTALDGIMVLGSIIFSFYISPTHCVKSVRIQFFWSVFSRIRTEYRKNPEQKNSGYGHFLRSDRDIQLRFTRDLWRQKNNNNTGANETESFMVSAANSCDEVQTS